MSWARDTSSTLNPLPPPLIADKSKFKPATSAVKKKRANYRLRKLISPKSPIQVLNEMVGAVHYTFVDNPPMPPHVAEQMQVQMQCRLYTARCAVDGEFFLGTGPSKAIAKNICAEHAVQHVVAKKGSDPSTLLQRDAEGNPLPPNKMEDETPWAQVASLALFKLFNDWQAQGYMVPQELLRVPDYYNNQGTLDPAARQPHQERPMEQQVQPAADDKTAGGAAAAAAAAGDVAEPRKVPENWAEKHPVQVGRKDEGGGRVGWVIRQVC